MLWLAVHCPTPTADDNDAASSPDGAPGIGAGTAGAAGFWPMLACWAGAYTPQVSLAPGALCLDISASLRLFGGLGALLGKLRTDLAELGVPVRIAVAATPLAALWLARAGDDAVCTDRAATQAALKRVPVAVLGLAPPLARRIAGFGLRHLGALLALPRASLGRRLGKPFVLDLARALGEIPDPQPCFVFPDHFEQGLELPAPIEAAPVLMFAARRLVAALAGWLAVRNAAVRGIDWRIEHGHGMATPLSIAFSSPVHAASRIERVLKERLASLSLPAPALDLSLRVTAVEPRRDTSRVLFPGAGQAQEDLADLVDRLVARLGPGRVEGLAWHADHRPERASMAAPAATGEDTPPPLPPRPLWLLACPVALRELDGRPHHRGELKLLAGPERIEAGWWDGEEIRRDYFVAIDRAGCRLWVFRDSSISGGWFLHGLFA